jgi:hypothetical protein
MKTFVVLVILFLTVSVMFLVYLLVGGYNVAASRPHAEWVSRLANFTVERSVRREGMKQRGPQFFNEIRARRGARPYHDLCATCHGGPGVPPSEMGRGMNPRPSDLRLSASKWTREEIFWITKNGLKLRGMPGFGSSRDDKVLWEVATFVKERLPALDSLGYAQLAGIHPPPPPDTAGCREIKKGDPARR